MINWTRKIQRKQSSKLNGLQDSLPPGWLPVEINDVQCPNTVNPRYWPYQTHLMAECFQIPSRSTAETAKHLGWFTLVHIQMYICQYLCLIISLYTYIFIDSPILAVELFLLLVSCCILSSSHWPLAKLYLFNSHVCLVNSPSQTRILLIKQHHDCLSTHMFLR